MIMYKHGTGFPYLQGIGEAKIETPDGTILVLGDQHRVLFPKPVRVKFQRPPPEPTKNRKGLLSNTIVAECQTEEVVLYGTIVIKAQMPSGSIFEASRNYPRILEIGEEQVIAAEHNNYHLTGNAKVLPIGADEELEDAKTYEIYSTLGDFIQVLLSQA